jgi:hypothetical protein
MRFRHVFLSMLAVGALMSAIAGGAQAASGPRYGLTASYVTCTGLDCPLAQPYDWSGSAECIARCAGAPQSGSFSIHLDGSTRRYPPNPCLSKRVTGSFSASWSDGSVTTASLSGRARDGKSYRVRGITDAASTVFPSDLIKGSLAYPTDPCTPGVVSYPSDPFLIAFST